MGLIAGLLAVMLSKSIYFFEDFFEKMPIHWAWWPAIGGVVIGLGGLVYPPVLGVGYTVIQRLISGEFTWSLILGRLDRKDADLEFLSWVGNVGWHSGSADYDRRRDRGCGGSCVSGDCSGGVASDWYGGGAGGGDWGAADGGGHGGGVDA